MTGQVTDTWYRNPVPYLQGYRSSTAAKLADAWPGCVKSPADENNKRGFPGMLKRLLSRLRWLPLGTPVLAVAIGNRMPSSIDVRCHMLRFILLALCLVGFDAHALERIGPSFRINTTSLNSGDQMPAIAALSNGRFVAAWSNGMVLNAQVYSAEGARVGSEIEITRLARNQAAPSVAGLQGGGFVVIWEGDANPDFSVRGQRFTATGAPLGAAFQVLPLMEGLHNPSVAALPDGGFVVVWTHSRTVQRIFSANAIALLLCGSGRDSKSTRHQ